MSNELQIYRKRLIPEECILLKDDIIVEQNEDYIAAVADKIVTLHVSDYDRVDAIISRKASRSASSTAMTVLCCTGTAILWNILPDRKIIP